MQVHLRWICHTPPCGATLKLTWIIFQWQSNGGWGSKGRHVHMRGKKKTQKTHGKVISTAFTFISSLTHQSTYGTNTDQQLCTEQLWLCRSPQPCSSTTGQRWWCVSKRIIQWRSLTEQLQRRKFARLHTRHVPPQRSRSFNYWSKKINNIIKYCKSIYTACVYTRTVRVEPITVYQTCSEAGCQVSLSDNIWRPANNPCAGESI